jgi:hypothetical protein
MGSCKLPQLACVQKLPHAYIAVHLEPAVEHTTFSPLCRYGLGRFTTDAEVDAAIAQTVSHIACLVALCHSQPLTPPLNYPPPPPTHTLTLITPSPLPPQVWPRQVHHRC